jgi:organic radical activating enzyme
MITKNLIIVLLVSLAFNGLFGYLSYSFYGAKQEAEQAFKIALESNSSLEKSIEKKKESCKIVDSVVAEYQKDKQAIESSMAYSLKEIDKLEAVTKPIISKKTTANENVSNENSTVDLDSKLPSSLIRLLSANCKAASGDCDHDAR